MLIFNGIHFTGGLVALAALRSGYKVGFKNLPDFNHNYEPELSGFFPWNLLQTSKAIGHYAFMMKCSSLFPHLYYPQRVLVLGKDEMSSTLIAAIDKLLGRDRETASLPLVLSNYRDYEVLSNDYKKGWLVYEYLFDRNRATIELIKLCLKEGALLNPEQSMEAFEVNCIPFNRTHSFIDSQEALLPFPNTISVKNDDDSLHFLRHFKGLSVQVDAPSEERFESLIDYAKPLISRIGAKISKRDFESNTAFLKRENISVGFKMNDSQLPMIKKNLKEAIDTIKSRTKYKVDIESLFDADTTISAENFRAIQAECNEKFDLAKQTGIEYNYFLHLFYRYRNHIDELIETAYAMMSEYKTSVLLWSKVIEEFHQSENILN